MCLWVVGVVVLGQGDLLVFVMGGGGVRLRGLVYGCFWFGGRI